jgi:hypothetical protein
MVLSNAAGDKTGAGDNMEDAGLLRHFRMMKIF